MVNKQGINKMTVAILSLSLLTVMAGAAVAPALNTIKEYFCDINQMYVQMIISMPALFIVIGNLFFTKLAKRIKARTLLMYGLALYVIGGSLAGIFNNIFIVLIFRALVGLGVGIIMPLSTGLLSYYYTKDQQDKLMGYSSAMNQLGGAVATLIAGMLAGVSWRLTFLVYLLGLISVILCMLYLPNEYIVNNETKKLPTENKEDCNTIEINSANNKKNNVFSQYYTYIIAMYLLMFTFFIYPSNFAIETTKEGIIPESLIAVIMAAIDIVGFVFGLLYVSIKKTFKKATKLFAPSLFLIAYVLLYWPGGWIGALAGSTLIGAANGVGIPFIISSASIKAGKNAVTTVLPLLSAALYLGQFTNPMIQSFFGNASPYLMGIIVASMLVAWSVLIKTDNNCSHSI